MSNPAASLLDIDTPPAAAPDGDFAGAMQQLAEEAQSGRSATPATSVSKAARAEFLMSIGQMIRPLAVGVEGLGERMAKLAAAQAAGSAPDLAPLHAAMEGLRGQLGRIGSVESANQKLFDAMHTELKGYKDGFLFDALQKPFVRDLVALHDDLGNLHSQIEARKVKPSADTGEVDFLNTLAQNFDNARHGLLETFERLDVERVDTVPGEPVDKRLQRVISFEPAPDAAHDARVALQLAARVCLARPPAPSGGNRRLALDQTGRPLKNHPTPPALNPSSFSLIPCTRPSPSARR